MITAITDDAFFQLTPSSRWWSHTQRLCVSGCVCVCSFSCKTFITCNRVLFSRHSFSGPLQEWSKSVCLTFLHNIWPLGYSTAQLINNATSTHVFPFTALSKETHHADCHYPAAPSTTMSPFSVIYPLQVRGRIGLFHHEHNRNVVKPDLLFGKWFPPPHALN